MVWAVVLFLLLGSAWGNSPSSASGASTGSNPSQEKKYEDPVYNRYRVSNIDTRFGNVLSGRFQNAYPFMEVVDAKGIEECLESTKGEEDPVKRERARVSCLGAYTWRAPYSTLNATEETARLLRKEWQRFEERYYWRTIVQLNNPVFYLVYCTLGLRGGELNPPEVEARISIDLGAIPEEAQGREDYREAYARALRKRLGLAVPASIGTHALDIYYPLPQVDKSEFCDGLSLEFLPIMYIPGFCIDLPGFSWCTPGYSEDRPLWFNENAAEDRVRRAIEHAIQNYYAEYLGETTRIATTPRIPNLATLDWENLQAYAPLPWTTNLLGRGAVATPVIKGLGDPARVAGEIQSELEAIKNVVEKGMVLFDEGVLPQAAKPGYAAYFLMGFLSIVDYPGLSALKETIMGFLRGLGGVLGMGDLDERAMALSRASLALLDRVEKLQERPGFTRLEAKTGAPGVYPFEELKRWYPIGSLPTQERFGYTTWFLVWNQMEATILPTPKDAMGVFGLLQRPLIYWWIPLRIKISFPPPNVYVAIDTPKAVPVKPYVLPFTGERVHWGWENVPEGYPIPKVRGKPLFPAAYDPLVR